MRQRREKENTWEKVGQQGQQALRKNNKIERRVSKHQENKKRKSVGTARAE